MRTASWQSLSSFDTATVGRQATVVLSWAVILCDLTELSQCPPQPLITALPGTPAIKYKQSQRSNSKSSSAALTQSVTLNMKKLLSMLWFVYLVLAVNFNGYSLLFSLGGQVNQFRMVRFSMMSRGHRHSASFHAALSICCSVVVYV